jgi:hypothetical protein
MSNIALNYIPALYKKLIIKSLALILMLKRLINYLF